jgi:hypothetical protein
LPESLARAALECGGEDAGDIPRRRQASADVPAQAHGADREDAEVEEEEGELVQVDASDIDDLGADESL